LADALGDGARRIAVASLDTIPAGPEELPPGAAATDMQTVAVLARGRELEIAAAAVLIVSEVGGERLDDAALEGAAKKAGAAAAVTLAKA
jgi:hypothetical protein